MEIKLLTSVFLTVYIAMTFGTKTAEASLLKIMTDKLDNFYSASFNSDREVHFSLQQPGKQLACEERSCKKPGKTEV
jgi:hypothetical protein